MDSTNWTHIERELPCTPGEQADVLFCSPGWGWAIVGMFSHMGDSHVWSEYDQQNDKYVEWDSTPPTLWQRKPVPPEA